MGLIIAFILAVLAGIIPGFHINTVSLILKGDPYIPLMIGIYVPLTVIPLIFLSSSDGSNISNLFILKKIKEKSLYYDVLELAPLGSLIGVFFSLLLYLLYPYLIKDIYELIRDNVYYLVFIVCISVILKSNNKLAFLIIFLISGLIGSASFEYLKVEKFFPMFVGFFSLTAIKKMKRVPRGKPKKNIYKFIFPMFIGALAGFFAVLLPGVSSPSMLISIISLSSFSNVLSYISMSYSFLSSQAFYSIINKELTNKGRIGAINYTNNYDYVLFILGVLIGSVLSKIFFEILRNKANIINEKAIKIFLVLMIFVFEGVVGILLMIVSYLLSIIREELNVGGNSHLGSIVVPLLIRFLF